MPRDLMRESRTARTFDQVYAEELPYVWSCLRTLGVRPHELEDAVQDVFIVVHRRLPEFRGDARLRTWLFSIAVRVASRRRRDAFRAHRRVHALVTHGAPDDDPPFDPEQEIARRRATARLERFAAALDPDKQAVFRLWAFEGRSPQDIADALALPRNTVYSRLRVVRQSFALVCERQHARDETRLSPQRRRDRDDAALRVRSAIAVLLPSPAPGGWWARLGAVGRTTAIGASASVGLAAAVVLALTSTAPEPPTTARPLTALATASEPEPAATAEPVVAEPRTDSPSFPTRQPPSPTRTAPTRAPRSRSTPAPPPRAPDPDALARATALIDEARAALAKGDLDAATLVLQRHADELPQGPLATEREAYRAIVACRQGEPTRARRFVDEHPDTRLAQRVTAACARRASETISLAGGHEQANEPTHEPTGPRVDPPDLDRDPRGGV